MMGKEKETIAEMDLFFMEKALKLAEEAAQNGDEPFGALLVKNEQIVMSGLNQVHTQSDPTHHAELGLIRQFCSENKVFDLSEYTLYTSCEPCCMCAGAMVWSHLGRMVYSLSHEALADIAGFNIMIGSKEIFRSSPNSPIVKKEILAEQAIVIYENYFK